MKASATTSPTLERLSSSAHQSCLALLIERAASCTLFTAVRKHRILRGFAGSARRVVLVSNIWQRDCC
jgi:hypothetical protein